MKAMSEASVQDIRYVKIGSSQQRLRHPPSRNGSRPGSNRSSNVNEEEKQI